MMHIDNCERCLDDLQHQRRCLCEIHGCQEHCIMHMQKIFQFVFINFDDSVAATLKRFLSYMIQFMYFATDVPVFLHSIVTFSVLLNHNCLTSVCSKYEDHCICGSASVSAYLREMSLSKNLLLAVKSHLQLLCST